MTTLNKELFDKDPTASKIPNEGVAEVYRPSSDADWDTLKWELESFVCEGEYERGLDRILGNYLANLSQNKQPAVWVSGFYGSGKSHLCRVLEHLWRDVELPSGRSARGLVTLSDEVGAHLRELTTQGRRRGGLWTAAGTLASGRPHSVRLAFLSVLLESAGLPQQYSLARFVLWAMSEGYLERVQSVVEAAGKDFDRELSNFLVSPLIAQAILDSDPTFASVSEVRAHLRETFPPNVPDISDNELFKMLDDVLRLKSDSNRLSQNAARLW